jgi:hypothetical protein
MPPGQKVMTKRFVAGASLETRKIATIEALETEDVVFEGRKLKIWNIPLSTFDAVFAGRCFFHVIRSCSARRTIRQSVTATKSIMN